VEVGKVDEAEQIARKALADEEKLNGKPVGSCTDALYKILASACISRGDYDGAIAHLRKAIEVASEVYGPQHRYTNDKRALLVNTLLAYDRLDEAVATLEEAKVDGELGETADTSLVLANARVALAQKDYDQARRLATEDFEKVKQGSVEPTIRQVDAMLVLAKIDLAQGRKNHAREILDSALMMMKPELNPTVPAVLEIKEMMELCKKPSAESVDNPR
jgi:tetratricopeptide (TPR) repeat protein